MRTPLVIKKYSHFEYWPWILFYIPVIPYWLWLALKNRSWAYFTVANPGIELGGFYGESKNDILHLIDNKYKPVTFLIEYNTKFENILSALTSNNLSYPIIAKPDIGERGTKVAKVNNEEELRKYHANITSNFIIQEFVNYEYEFGVLYSRMPNEDKGIVTSVTLKKFLSVTGDGKHNIKELMEQSTRARFQLKRFEAELGEKLNIILKPNEEYLLEPIGNHCRGTEFINNNFLINDVLNKVFNDISNPIKGFYFGRFDLKVKSIEDLYKGQNIKILELNGASSEPGHIYDTRNNLIKAYKDLTWHWKRLSDISKINISLGHKPVSLRKLSSVYIKFVILKKQ
jgi:hypothetical protein